MPLAKPSKVVADENSRWKSDAMGVTDLHFVNEEEDLSKNYQYGEYVDAPMFKFTCLDGSVRNVSTKLYLMIFKEYTDKSAKDREEVWLSMLRAHKAMMRALNANSSS